MPTPHPTAVALGHASPFPPADDEAEEDTYEDDAYANPIRCELVAAAWMVWMVVFLLLVVTWYALYRYQWITTETERTLSQLTFYGCMIGWLAPFLIAEYASSYW